MPLQVPLGSLMAWQPLLGIGRRLRRKPATAFSLVGGIQVAPLLRKALLGAVLGLGMASCHGSPAPAWAEWDQTKEETYVQIIITEASGEPLDGQIAVCEVLRNRHWSTRGFAGIKRPDLREWLSKQTPGTIDRALAAYRRARAGSQITKGATHFENVEAFGTPYWAKGMTRVGKIGRHTFFKE